MAWRSCARFAGGWACARKRPGACCAANQRKITAMRASSLKSARLTWMRARTMWCSARFPTVATWVRRVRSLLGFGYEDIASSGLAWMPLTHTWCALPMGAFFQVRLRTFDTFEAYRALYPGRALYPFIARRRQALARSRPRGSPALHAGVRQRAERPPRCFPGLWAERVHPPKRQDRLPQPVCRRFHRRVCLPAKGGNPMIYEDARGAIGELVTLERPFFKPRKTAGGRLFLQRDRWRRHRPRLNLRAGRAGGTGSAGLRKGAGLCLRLPVLRCT